MSTPVYVVGHKNPDNDAISAAVGYAYFKNQLMARAREEALGSQAESSPEASAASEEFDYIPVRLGPLPEETEGIMSEFEVTPPALIERVGAGQKVVLVDHNELSQAVDGLSDAEVIEIVDHHRIGDVTTKNPIRFVNLPYGSSATIVALHYRWYNVELPKEIAAVLLSAVMTDTVILKSPTATPIDREIVEWLGGIVGEDPYEYGARVFRFRKGDADMPVDRLVGHDAKEFKIEGGTILISQHETVNLEGVLAREEEIREHLRKLQQEKGYQFVLLLATDIIAEGSQFIVEGDHSVVDSTFDIDSSIGVWMPGILSRKKQVASRLL